jgi:lipoprotein signal peptidase
MMKYFSVLIVVLDQLSKFIVHSNMSLYDSFPVIPSNTLVPPQAACRPQFPE